MKKPGDSESTLASGGGRFDIAGIPVPELALQFGTPTYVYDAAKILCDAIRRAGPNRPWRA